MLRCSQARRKEDLDRMFAAIEDELAEEESMIEDYDVR